MRTRIDMHWGTQDTLNAKGAQNSGFCTKCHPTLHSHLWSWLTSHSPQTTASSLYSQHKYTLASPSQSFERVTPTTTWLNVSATRGSTHCFKGQNPILSRVLYIKFHSRKMVSSYILLYCCKLKVGHCCDVLLRKYIKSWVISGKETLLGLFNFALNEWIIVSFKEISNFFPSTVLFPEKKKWEKNT